MSRGKIYDYILIDGSHLAHDVLTDAVLCYWLLKPGGIMFFDDYGQNGEDATSTHFPRLAIDAFTRCFADQGQIVHRAYHLVFKKSNS